MADNRNIYIKLRCAVREGRLETVRKLINSYGLSFSQELLGGYVLLCDALQYIHADIAKLLLESGSKVNSENEEPSNTPLHFAALIGDKGNVAMILDKDGNIDAMNKEGRTPLHLAVQSESFEVIELLLDHGADVNVKGEDDITPLHVAAEAGCGFIFDYLVYRGACIHSSTLKKGYTPLHTAINLGHNEIVQLLLQRGANVDILDKDRKTVLQYAVEVGNEIIVEEVLKYIPDINNKRYRSILATAVKRSERVESPFFGGGRHSEKIETLLKHGFKVNPKDARNSKLLFITVEKGYFKIAQDLLKHGANVNSRLYNATYNKEGRTPLHSAAQHKQEEMAKLLISYGAGVNTRDEYEKTPTFYSAWNGDLEMMKLLLTNGAHVNPEIMNIAVREGHFNIVEAFLEYGVDINAGDEDGYTALHKAAEYGYGAIVKVLLERGANVESKARNGLTPLHFGAEGGNQEIVETLLKSGADVNSRSDSGGTALHCACRQGNMEVVITLLKYGADINITDSNNLTPVDISVAESSQWHLDYDVYNPDNDDVFIRHIVKLKAANLYVSKENLQSASNNMNGVISDFQNKCEVEIANMKSEKINNTNISFYDILTKDTNSLAMCMSNENIVSALKSDEYKTTFPIYVNMIEMNIRKGMERQDLLEQWNKVSRILFPVLPNVCIKIILSYLSNDDLRKLTH